MELLIEVSIDGDILASIAAPFTNIQSELEGLWDTFDEEYGLTDAYENRQEWVAQLTLSPYYKEAQ